MAGNYRKPTDNKHKEIPFKIMVDDKEYSGTITEEGEPLAFGVLSAFYVRIPGEPRMTLSIYRGEWQMQAKPEFVKALSEFIEAYYE